MSSPSSPTPHRQDLEEAVEARLRLSLIIVKTPVAWLFLVYGATWGCEWHSANEETFSPVSELKTHKSSFASGLETSS